MFESDTVHEFIDKCVSWFIENHDSSTDGASTGGVISLCRQLKDRVWENVSVTSSQKKYIMTKLVSIAGDDDDGYNVSSQIEELADEINRWN